MDGLVVGAAAVASRFGYAHGPVRGPWLLAWAELMAVMALLV